MSRLVFGGLLLFITTTALAENVNIDTAHSEVGFVVTHLGISKVKGNFTRFDGSFQFDAKKKSLSAFKASIDPSSINTNEPKRDDHLRSPDFFDVQKFPKIEFASSKVEVQGKSGKIIGDLTMHGVTKPLTLDFTYAGPVIDPWGKERVAVQARGKIQRKDWGLTWNKMLDKGGVVVSDDVDLAIELEGIVEKAETAKK